MVARLVVIGGGPMGLAAAISACDSGYDVTLLERDEVGASLRGWGPTRFFTPLSMNISPRMRELLGDDAPPDDALLTGPEMADLVLRPLAEREPLRGRVRSRHRVVAVGRRGLTRGDYAAHPIRGERPFRLFVETPEGETTIEAEVVLDATGGYVLPASIGSGGLPARGESRMKSRLIRTLGELHARADSLRGKRVLLVGNGHSAANAIGALESLGAEVTWVVRTPNRRPCVAIANDPLPERARVVDHANALAEKPLPFLTMKRRATIDAIRNGGESIEVELTSGEKLVVDHVAAFTGYRPDASIVSELAVESSPVTEGGARLYRAISNITDCLSVPAVHAEDVASGEPNFFFIGSRSYGRAPTFLLQTGLAQLEAVFDSISHP